MYIGRLLKRAAIVSSGTIFFLFATSTLWADSLTLPRGDENSPQHFGSEWRFWPPLRPTCRCCEEEPGGKCCQNRFCNPATALNELTSTGRNATVASSLFGAESDGPQDVLKSCSLRISLKLDAYSEENAAREFFNLETVKKCDDFVPALLQERENILRDLEVSKINERDIKISRQYTEVCLQTTAAVYKPKLASKDIADVKSRLMLLVTDSGRPYCHSFRIGNNLITADHCLRSKGIGQMVKIRGIESSTTLDAQVIYRGGEQNSSFPEKDFAVLALNQKGEVEDRSWLGQPVANSRIFIIQVNMYRLIAEGASLEKPLVNLVTVEDNPACKLFGVSQTHFLLNACQSDGGTSGTPYFQKDTHGNLIIVGVHGGETQNIQAEDVRDCSVSLPNYGVKLPVEVLQRIFDEDR